MRAREFAKWLEQQLADAGVAEAAAEANLILEDLGITRLLMVTQADDPVSASQTDQARRILAKRKQRIPLQHILGYQFFRKLQLTVNSDVLIPRPETEELVQLAIDRAPLDARVADVGTGSGAIAISLKLERPDLDVIASEISEPALTLAKRNAKALGIKVTFEAGDALEPLLAHAPLDMIVSNPPYVPQANLAGLEPEVRDHEPVQALCPGPDALHFYKLFAAEGPRYLHPDGWLLAELEAGLANETVALFQGPDWKFVELKNDLQGMPRFVCAQRS